MQVAGVVQILEIGDCITVLISSASYCVDCRKLWGLVSSKLFGGIPTEDNWATCDSSLSIRLYINAIRHNLSNLLKCWLIAWHISLGVSYIDGGPRRLGRTQCSGNIDALFGS